MKMRCHFNALPQLLADIDRQRGLDLVHELISADGLRCERMGSCALCDNARRSWFPEARHWLQREEAARVSEELIEFLSG